VRWTEQRNFEAVLDMLAEGRIDVSPLITHRFPIDEAVNAYELVSGGGALGILLQYPVVMPLQRRKNCSTQFSSDRNIPFNPPSKGDLATRLMKHRQLCRIRW